VGHLRKCTFYSQRTGSYIFFEWQHRKLVWVPVSCWGGKKETEEKGGKEKGVWLETDFFLKHGRYIGLDGEVSKDTS